MPDAEGQEELAETTMEGSVFTEWPIAQLLDVIGRTTHVANTCYSVRHGEHDQPCKSSDPKLCPVSGSQESHGAETGRNVLHRGR